MVVLGRKSVSKDEDFAPAWLMLGHSFSRSGDHDQAVGAYALLARHLCPASLHPRIFLAMEFMRTRQPALAQPYLVEALGAEPTNPWVVNEQGMSYLLRKDYAKALGALKRAYTYLRARHAGQSAAFVVPGVVDLPVAILGNILLVHLRSLPSAASPLAEMQAALGVAKEALRLAPSRLGPSVLVACAVVHELLYGLTDEAAYCTTAVDLYAQALGLSPTSKVAMEGHSRCLVQKINDTPLPIVPPHEHPLEGGSPPPLDGDSESMEMDEDEAYAPMDVESSPSSHPGGLLADRPASLRRKLTATLSFGGVGEPEAPLVDISSPTPGQEPV